MASLVQAKSQKCDCTNSTGFRPPHYFPTLLVNEHVHQTYIYIYSTFGRCYDYDFTRGEQDSVQEAKGCEFWHDNNGSYIVHSVNIVQLLVIRQGNRNEQCS
jgi:hypothetical protein